MPSAMSAIQKKPNFFQRLFRHVVNFRKKHPYWFAFIVGAVVGLLLATTLTVMILVPEATPAFLIGVKLLASKMAVSVAVPTFLAGNLFSGLFVGALSAGVKRVFDGLRSCFRGGLLKSARRMPSSTNSIKSFVDKINAAAPSVTPPSSFRASVSESPIPALPRPTTPLQVSGSPHSSLAFFPVIDETSPKEKAKADKRRAKEAERCFEDAANQYEEMRKSIIRDFDEAIKIVETIPQGDFHHNRMKCEAVERIKSMKKSFIQGEGFAGDENAVFSDEMASKPNEQVLLTKEKLEALRRKIESPAYQDCDRGLKQIEAIGNAANNQKREVAASRRKIGSVYNDPAAYKARVEEIKKDHDEKVAQVYGNFLASVEKAKAGMTEEAPRQRGSRRFG